MGKKSPDTHDGIELRSEKVRRILGDIPRPLVAWGIFIVVFVFIVFACVVVFFPFPHGDGETVLQWLMRAAGGGF